MRSMTEADMIEVDRRAAKAWWLFLVTGVLWVILAFVVLSWDPGTTAVIGYLTGFMLIAAGVNELVTIGFTREWRWLHGVLGVLCLVAGILALMAPLQTFGILALLIGWYLLFKGLVGVIFSIVERDELHLWGLLLGAGIIEMAIGLWAIGYPGRSAWLLVLWVGIGALVRGITEVVLAFKLRGLRDQVAAATA